jgi:hypothetical protein
MKNKGWVILYHSPKTLKMLCVEAIRKDRMLNNGKYTKHIIRLGNPVPKSTPEIRAKKIHKQWIRSKKGLY